MGYSKWENFSTVIEKARESCKNAGQKVADHLPDVSKVIEADKGVFMRKMPASEDVKKVERWQ